MNFDDIELVVDTNIVSYMLGSAPLALRYRPVVRGREVAMSFQTVAEVLYGARMGHFPPSFDTNWRELRDAWPTVPYDDELIDIYAAIRAQANRAGRGLTSPDAWVASTALWLQVPLVTHDRDFRNIPELTVITFADPR